MQFPQSSPSQCFHFVLFPGVPEFWLVGWREEWKCRNRPQRLPDGALHDISPLHENCSDLMTVRLFLTLVCSVPSKYASKYITGINLLHFHFQDHSLPYPLQETDDWMKIFSYDWNTCFGVFCCSSCMLHCFVVFISCWRFRFPTPFHALLVVHLVFANDKINKGLNISVVSELFLFNLQHRPQGGNRVSLKVIDYYLCSGKKCHMPVFCFLQIHEVFSGERNH